MSKDTFHEIAPGVLKFQAMALGQDRCEALRKSFKPAEINAIGRLMRGKNRHLHNLDRQRAAQALGLAFHWYSYNPLSPAWATAIYDAACSQDAFNMHGMARRRIEFHGGSEGRICIPWCREDSFTNVDDTALLLLDGVEGYGQPEPAWFTRDEQRTEELIGAWSDGNTGKDVLDRIKAEDGGLSVYVTTYGDYIRHLEHLAKDAAA